MTDRPPASGEPSTDRINDDEHWHRGPSKSCSICRMAEARATETTFEKRHRQWMKDDEYRAAYIAALDRLASKEERCTRFRHDEHCDH